MNGIMFVFVLCWIAMAVHAALKPVSFITHFKPLAFLLNAANAKDNEFKGFRIFCAVFALFGIIVLILMLTGRLSF